MVRQQGGTVLLPPLSMSSPGPPRAGKCGETSGRPAGGNTLGSHPSGKWRRSSRSLRRRQGGQRTRERGRGLACPSMYFFPLSSVYISFISIVISFVIFLAPLSFREELGRRRRGGLARTAGHRDRWSRIGFGYTCKTHRSRCHGTLGCMKRYNKRDYKQTVLKCLCYCAVAMSATVW